MARLNYHKLAIEQNADKRNYEENQRDWQRRNKDTWLLGKHYGKKLKTLPLNYLIWASENLEEGNYHKAKADSELHRRWHNQQAKQTAHKVSGPDCNSALEKLRSKLRQKTY